MAFYFEKAMLEKYKSVGYNRNMKRKKYIDNSKMSIASKSLINKLSRKFRRRGGVIINDESSIVYLDSRNAEAITLDAYTILMREKISISALIEELEHSEQYLRNENDGSRLDVVKNEILAKEKSLRYADRYKLPKIEIEFVKKDIELYKKIYRRLTEDESNKNS
ncbi:hypothetical protein KMP11_02930 [Gemella sp. zg-570]|uniref:hypothetical protein n=2 Tax=unclassified Gemella TaxID=2624949 RepID=UPI001C0E27B8|nr:hypothetical protein [Gemella sp. zg-570]MBU0279342.1 hypothetical protein [Gemella sp. zg-1178]QWQ39295.1 hypothetical protein KMP11_02930 [Gemella sp. zg-570]